MGRNNRMNFGELKIICVRLYYLKLDRRLVRKKMFWPLIIPTD
jgi:hypothetical protein